MFISDTLWDADWARPQLFNILNRVGTEEAFNEIVLIATKYSDYDAESMGRLGRAYRDGRGVEKNLDVAAEWMRKAADAGLTWARWELFDILWRINTPESLDVMIAMGKPLAEDGNRELQGRLGRAYRDGRGVEKDLDVAAEWMRKAADAGLTWARWELFDILWIIGTAEAYSEMCKAIRLPAFKGNPESMGRLGRAYRDGRGVEKDLDVAAEWMRKAADAGLAWAKLELSDILWEIGTDETNIEMVSILETYSAEGNVDAMLRLSMAHYHGIGVEKNDEKVLYWAKKARNYKSPNASKLIELLEAKNSLNRFTYIGQEPNSVFHIYATTHRGNIMDLLNRRVILSQNFDCILIVNDYSLLKTAKRLVGNGLFCGALLYNHDLGLNWNNSKTRREIIEAFDVAFADNKIALDKVAKVYTMSDTYDALGAYLRIKKVKVIDIECSNPPSEWKYFTDYLVAKASPDLTRMQIESKIFDGRPEYPHMERNVSFTFSDETFDDTHAYQRIDKDSKKKILDSFDVPSYGNKTVILPNSATLMDYHGLKRDMCDFFMFVLKEFYIRDGGNTFVKLHPYSYPEKYFKVNWAETISGDTNIDIIQYSEQKLKKIITFGSSATEKIGPFCEEVVNLGLSFYSEFKYIPFVKYIFDIFEKVGVTQTIINDNIASSFLKPQSQEFISPVIRIEMNYSENAKTLIYINSTKNQGKNYTILFKIKSPDFLITQKYHVNTENPEILETLESKVFDNGRYSLSCEISK